MQRLRKSKKNGKGFSQNKYKNKKVVIDGIIFASRTESEYYLALKEEEKNGIILSIEVQPRFILQETFKKGGKTFRQIEYVSDFKVVGKDGSIRIIEIKGFETDIWKLKQKLFEYKYPDLHIEVIYNKNLRKKKA